MHLAGVVLVGPNQRIVALNSAAQQLFSRDCSFLVDGEVLRLPLPTDGQLIRIDRPAGKAPLVAWVTSLQSIDSGPAYRAVTLVDSGRRPTINRDALAALFRLTQAEARLADQVIAGRTPSEAAKALGVTIHTVRTYLKRLYLKVGVRSQAGLVLALISRSTAFTAVLPPGG